MLSNYLKITFRNLRRHPGYALINVAGLGLGIAAAVLIFLYARYELTYDHFHEHAGDIYLVYKERSTPTGTQETYDTWLPLLDKLRADFPAVVNGTRTLTVNQWVQRGDMRFEESVTLADPSLLEVFTFPLLRGPADNPLPNNNAVVISQEIARKYFGDQDPIGQVLTINHTTDYTVTGVLTEIPPNATLRPEIVIPIASAPWYEDDLDNWDGSFLSTYIQLSPETSVDDLEAQFPALIAGIWDDEVAARTRFKLLPLLDVRDTFAGSHKYAYILLAVALGTILIACINFVNLATARSLERAKEIGMRKVLGAARTQLIRQLLSESALLGLLALAVGLALAQTLLPVFNDLYGLELRLNVLNEPWLPAVLVGLGLVVGLLSGSYPAVFLSRFRPATSLRGTFKASPAGLRLRHGLVVVQFTLSIVLITGTLIMWHQVQYMKNKDLAFDRDNVLVLPVEPDDFADPEEAVARLETFKEELRRLPDVQSVTSSSHIPGRWSGWFTFAWPEGGDPEHPMRVRLAFMDARYFETYGIDFIEGRPFIEGSELDAGQSVIVNASAVRDFGWDSAVGKTISGGGSRATVVGVVEDYNYLSLEEAVAPVLHLYRPPDNGVHNFISLKLASNDLQATLAAIEERWKHLDPSRSFEYFFVDDTFNQLYEAQDRLVAVAGAFSILAILIACLGLFGLASLLVAQRTKEIGIRKVLGATAAGLALLLSKGFTRMVVIAFLLAVPLAYAAMERWLENFAYRIDLAWWMFVVGGLAALAIAWLTVSFQTLKAAVTDPVKSLRYE